MNIQKRWKKLILTLLPPRGVYLILQGSDSQQLLQIEMARSIKVQLEIPIYVSRRTLRHFGESESAQIAQYISSIGANWCEDDQLLWYYRKTPKFLFSSIALLLKIGLKFMKVLFRKTQKINPGAQLKPTELLRLKQNIKPPTAEIGLSLPKTYSIASEVFHCVSKYSNFINLFEVEDGISPWLVLIYGLFEKPLLNDPAINPVAASVQKNGNNEFSGTRGYENTVPKRLRPLVPPVNRFNRRMELKEFPIIINNFNRLDYLKKLILNLRSRGFENIHILDNNSSYLPLLEYYETAPIRHIEFLKQNLGYLAFWKSGYYLEFIDKHFILTDPDCLPDKNCPADFIEKALNIFDQYPFIEKVGLGLRIDDLPDNYDKKANVISHEAQFWKGGTKDFYYAGVDTTFAVYRPNRMGGFWLKGARLKPPYLVQHLPWYQNSLSPSGEELFYKKTSNQDTNWT